MSEKVEKFQSNFTDR